VIAFLVTLARFVQAMARSLKDPPDFQSLFFLVVLIFLSGPIFYPRVEGWSLLDSFYLNSTTPTTVGYGDLSPSTPVSKVLTVVYIFIGIGLILGFVNAVARRTFEARRGGPPGGERG
jgi:hypothetical protein